MALGVLSSKYFDISDGDYPHLIHVSGDIYAIAYRGAGMDGFLKTISITSEGTIGTVIGEWEFDTGGASYPFIIHISGDVYAIAYRRYTGVGTNYDGYLITFTIDSEGVIGDLIGEEVISVNLGAAVGSMIHISGDIYAIVFAMGAYEYGRLATVEIDSAGNIVNPAVAGYTYDGRVTCIHPWLIHISGTTYAIGYSRGVITITIGNDGSIGAELDSVAAYYPYEIIHVAADVYAIVRVRWLETLTIDAAGNIRDTALASLEYDASANWCPIILQLAAGPFAILYQGAGLDGFIKTVAIEDNGTIGEILEDLEFDTSSAQWPSAIEIAPSIIAVAYTSAGYGRIKTTGELTLASVTTQAVTDILDSRAEGNGNVMDLGSPNPTQHGVCWNTTGTPTRYYPNSATYEGPVAATGAFTSAMTELIKGTKYYVRAYVTNKAGTAYGEEVSFTTLTTITPFVASRAYALAREKL